MAKTKNTTSSSSEEHPASCPAASSPLLTPPDLFTAPSREHTLLEINAGGIIRLLDTLGPRPANKSDSKNTSAAGNWSNLRRTARRCFHLQREDAGISQFSTPGELHTVPQLLSNMRLTSNMKIGYGCTETSPVTFCGSPLDNMERKSETSGYIVDHTEAKVVNSGGEVVPLGTPGELLIRGACVMLGYWEDEVKTQESIGKDRWYKTGDVVTLDAFSYCRVVGRIKDMIIRGGENVYPAEIEQLLHTHPKVKEAQVVGVEDPRMGEEVCACIILSAGEECSVEEIRAFCKGKISHFKIPRYVLFVSGYPLTASGKIQKIKLREEVEQQLRLKKTK